MPANPLVATKTYLPQPVPGLVVRARLRERLDWTLVNQRRLVLISALAGSGKSTLLADWVAAAALPCAWISLDAQDNQPSLFWAYLITALQRQSPGFAQALLVELLSPQAPPADRFLPEFLNQAAQLPGRIVIVLDDYHLIESPAIHDSLIYLIEHLPETLLIAICTRSDPPMPLSRWRVRGYLAEVRLQDLRFNAVETQAFLRDFMKLSLEDEDITLLEARTEGWAAGLQLAALALQESMLVNDREGQKKFITRFSASHQYVLDYLTSEVLAHLPDESHHFLLQTSILKQLSEPLCRAVTGNLDSTAVMSALVRKNLFLIPLDAEGIWYRYHHLFTEMLQMRLERQGAGTIAQLHMRAAKWYEQAGRVDDSLYHAVQAGVVDYAVEIILHNWQQVIYRGWPNQVLGWLDSLPVKLVQEHPGLSLARAWTQWIRGQAKAAQEHSEEAQQAYQAWLLQGRDLRGEYETILGEVAVLKALAAVRFERFEDALQFSTQSLQMPLLRNPLVVGLAAMAQAAALRDLGKVEPAIQAFYQAVDASRRAGNYLAVGTSSFALGRLLQLQGRLGEAENFYRGLSTWLGQTGHTPAEGIVQLGLGEVLYERNEVAQSAALQNQAWKHATYSGYMELIGYGCLLRARLLHAAGNNAGAIAALREGVEDLQRFDALSLLGEIQALLAVYLAEAGQVEEALLLLPEPLAVSERLARLSAGYQHLDQARVWLFAGRAEAVLVFAAQFEQIAAGLGARRWQIEALLLLALAQARMGKPALGYPALQKSLALAQTQGNLRLFLDGGEAVRDMLNGLYPTLTNPALTQFARRILDAYPAPAPKKVLTPPGMAASLSEREVQVLRLLSLGLSNQAVADQLYISLATVKTHIRHIFEKLGVENRVEALNRAKELHLF